MQGDVDGGDGAGEDAAALEILAAVHLLPQGTDAPRVLADQELAEVVDGALHGELAAGDARLSPTVVAGVGLDLDHEQVARAAPDGKALDVGDLHGYGASLAWRPQLVGHGNRPSPFQPDVGVPAPGITVVRRYGWISA